MDAGWASTSDKFRFSLPTPAQASENPGLLSSTPVAQRSTLKWQLQCVGQLPWAGLFRVRAARHAGEAPTALHCSGHGTAEMSEEKLSMAACRMSNGRALPSSSPETKQLPAAVGRCRH